MNMLTMFNTIISSSLASPDKEAYKQSHHCAASYCAATNSSRDKSGL
jgi:hypothetical protein